MILQKLNLSTLTYWKRLITRVVLTHMTMITETHFNYPLVGICYNNTRNSHESAANKFVPSSISVFPLTVTEDEITPQYNQLPDPTEETDNPW